MKLLNILFINLIFFSIANAEPTAILVSGGDNANSNSCDFVKDIDRANDVLYKWKKINLVADGEIINGPPNSIKCDNNGDELTGTRELTRNMPKSKVDGSASLNILETKLRITKNLNPGEPLVIYFTDHGGRTNENNKEDFSVALWNENLKKEDLQRMILEFKTNHPDNPLILIHDHCFSGGMMDNFINPSTQELIPGVCGFASSTATEYSEVGDSFMKKAHEMLPQVKSKQDPVTFSTVFNDYKFKGSELSTPVSSSDIYLEKIFDENKKELGKEFVFNFFCREPNKSLNPFIGLTNLSNSISDIQRFTFESNLKKQLKSLYDETQIDQKVTLNQLAKLVAESKKYILQKEKELLESQEKLNKIKEKWAQGLINSKFGADAFQQLEQFKTNSDLNRKIKLNNGKEVTLQELNSAWNSSIQAANEENPDFSRYVKNGNSPKIFDKIKKNNVDFVSANMKLGPMLRLLQLSRRMAAFEHLSLRGMRQFINLLTCENTKI